MQRQQFIKKRNSVMSGQQPCEITERGLKTVASFTYIKEAKEGSHTTTTKLRKSRVKKRENSIASGYNWVTGCEWL